MPVRLDNPVMTLLPAVRVPLGESAPALATFDIVTVPAFAFSAVMYVPGAMPGGVAIRGSAAALPVAALDKTTVVPLIAVIAPVMKLPETVAPTANPAVEGTEVTLVLPLVT